MELFDNVYDPANFIEKVSDSEISLIQDNGGAKIDQLQSIKDPLPNENFILRNGEKSILLLLILSKKKKFKLIPKPPMELSHVTLNNHLPLMF